VNPALRAELFKQRSTRTLAGLFSAMVGLVVFAVVLHGLGLAAENFESTSKQLTILFGWGEVLGALFAAVLGAMSITGEVRHGTIRPTLLVTPQRDRVVASKLMASVLIGAAFGLLAGALAAGAGSAALSARGIDIRLGAIDYLFVVGGAGAAAALWAAIGVGVGAVVRNQVPALVGIVVWLLFIENLLVGDIGRVLPGAAGKAITGQDPGILVAPAVGLVLLTIYAAGAAVIGWLTTARRDFA
jgi:ABC-type transport system involved in multi-copper enzyme maturation permease subunit